MNNMEESLGRGTNGPAKASHAVRVGQKQARRTQYQHIQQKKEALEEGWQGGNQITNWFWPKAGPHTIDVQDVRITHSQDQVITELPARSHAGSTTALSQSTLHCLPTSSVNSRSHPPVIQMYSPHTG